MQRSSFSWESRMEQPNGPAEASDRGQIVGLGPGLFTWSIGPSQLPSRKAKIRRLTVRPSSSSQETPRPPQIGEVIVGWTEPRTPPFFIDQLNSQWSAHSSNDTVLIYKPSVKYVHRFGTEPSLFPWLGINMLCLLVHAIITKTNRPFICSSWEGCLFVRFTAKQQRKLLNTVGQHHRTEYRNEITRMEPVVEFSSRVDTIRYAIVARVSYYFQRQEYEQKVAAKRNSTF